VPSKFAAEIVFPESVEKPAPVTVTEVPAGPDEGESVTVGTVMVKATAGGVTVVSYISTLCVPARRL